MAKVKTFHVNNLPNDNHLPFNMMVLGYAKASQMVSTQMAVIVAAYEAAVQTEDEAMHQLMGSPLTPDIEQTDKQRDNKYYIIDHLVDVYLHYPEGSERTDAETVNKYMKVNNVKTVAQYDRETGQILNLVQDLEANCANELQRLGLTEHVAELKRLNQQMYDLLQQRDELNAEKMKDAVRNARLKVDKLYHSLTGAVNAFAYVDAEPYLTFIRNTNQTIDRLNLQVFKITGSSADKNEVDNLTPGGSEDSENSEDSEGSENKPNTPEGGEQQPEGGEQQPGGGEQQPGGGEETFDFTPGMNWPADRVAPNGYSAVTFVKYNGERLVKLYRQGATIVSQGNLPENEEGYIWSGIYSKLTGSTHTVEEVEE